jgi:hypothetical protein
MDSFHIGGASKNDDEGSSPMKYFKDYMKLKTKYFDEYTNDPEKPRPIHRVFGIKTNCPLIFREKNGAYIVEVVHPSCPDRVFYRHTINVHNYIDLTYLHRKIMQIMEEMNVPQEKLFYLRKIELYKQRKAKLMALQSIPSRNPAEASVIAEDLYREEMTQLDTEIEGFKQEYSSWLATVKRYTDQLYAIQQIMNEMQLEKQEELNTYQMQYFYLWNKQQDGLDPVELYKVSKLLYQPKEIEKGSIVEHAGEWYIVLESSKQKKDVLVSMKPLKSSVESEAGDERTRTITVLGSELTHQEGFYQQWKGFKFRERVRISKDKWRATFGEEIGVDNDDGDLLASTEIVVEEFPETPGKKPKHIMMSYINEENCELEVEEKKSKKEKKKKKEKKEKKEKTNKDTEKAEEVIEEELEPAVEETEEELEGELEGELEPAVEETEGELEEVAETPQEAPKTPTPPKSSIKRGRLLISIPKKKRKSASPSPSPRRYSPVRNPTIKKSSLKKTIAEPSSKIKSSYYKQNIELKKLYLEKLYRSKVDAQKEIKDEYPDKYKMFADDDSEGGIVFFEYLPDYEEGDEIPIEILDGFKEDLIQMFPEFVDKIDVNGKRIKILDTVSLYNNLVHSPEEMKWVNPEEDEEDGEYEEEEDEYDEEEEEEEEVSQDRIDQAFQIYQEQMKKLESQKK